MATRTLVVRIKNTGNVTYTFWVGATISTGVAGSGCGIWIPGGNYWKDLRPASITLAPGQTGEVRFTFDDSYLDQPSRYTVPPNKVLYAIVKVWKQYDSANNRMIGCITGSYKSFTAKGVATVNAQIVSITIY